MTMKVRYGMLLTKQREWLVEDYRKRRRPRLHLAFCPNTDAYWEWVKGFERFMCRGIDTRPVEQVRSVALRPALAHDGPGVQKPTLEDAGRPDASTAQVD